MKVLFFAVMLGLVAVLCACSTDPVTKATATSVPTSFIYVRSFTFPHAGASAQVTFYRDSGFLGSGCTHDIYVNQTKVFSIDPAQYITLYLPPGQYFFQLKSGGGICPNVDISQETTLKAGDKRAYRDLTPSVGGIHLTRIK